MDRRTILLHAEQGFGDTFQFIRYAAWIKEHNERGNVIVQCPKALIKLLAECPYIGVVIEVMDAHAFARLVADHSAPLILYARQWCCAPEDVVQEAFLKLWERWDQIDRIDDPTAYLFRVALNAFRRRRLRAATAVRKLLPVAEPPDPFEEVEVRADIRQLLLHLSERQRAALLLVDLLGYSSEQAARILRVRPSTVRSLATQGRRALRAEGARDA